MLPKDMMEQATNVRAPRVDLGSAVKLIQMNAIVILVLMVEYVLTWTMDISVIVYQVSLEFMVYESVSPKGQFVVKLIKIDKWVP